MQSTSCKILGWMKHQEKCHNLRYVDDAILMAESKEERKNFLMKVKEESENIQPWHTPFPILNLSIVPCLVLTVASWPAYRFLRREVRWSGIPISLRVFQFVVIYTVKGFIVVNVADMDIFLELTCFSYDPVNIGNLISGSSILSTLYNGNSWFMYCWSLAWKILRLPC